MLFLVFFLCPSQKKKKKYQQEDFVLFYFSCKFGYRKATDTNHLKTEENAVANALFKSLKKEKKHTQGKNFNRCISRVCSEKKKDGDTTFGDGKKCCRE